MPFKPNTYALTLVLALLTSLGPLATDMYLPSLPDITRLLDANVAQTQYTLSGFLIGFAGGQLIYGPISDRIGRRPVLVMSLGAILIADIACATSPTIEVLVVSRLVQGVATAGPIVLARSVVRDLYSGARAGQELALMGAIMGVVPATAPFLGGFIHDFLGWRATFFSQTLLCLFVLLMVFFGLPETLRERHPERLTLAVLPRIYSGLMSEPAYRSYVAIVTLSYAGLFSFISASSFVLQGVYGWSEIAFGLAFGICSVSYITGTFSGTRLVKRIGLPASVRAGAGLLAFGGAAMVMLMATGLDDPFALVGTMMIYMVGVGIAMPHSVAAALTFYPDRAGAASSLMGFVQMSVGAAIGVIVGHAFNGSAWPLAIALASAGILAFLLAVIRRQIADPE